MAATSDSKTFNCVTFNCFGFKNSCVFINKLCLKYDICFLNEHWLNPCDIPTVKSDLKQRKLWSVFKSSMDPEVIQSGRCRFCVQRNSWDCI